MRKCSHCKERKPLNEFNFKIKAKGIMQYQCRNCSRIYIKSHYKRNREYYLQKAKERNQKIREVIRHYIWEYLIQHPCIDCGEKDPIVLEFDHITDKLFEVSSIGRNRTLSQVEKDIKKCEVRCANCHRKKTAKQRNWYKLGMPL